MNYQLVLYIFSVQLPFSNRLITYISVLASSCKLFLGQKLGQFGTTNQFHGELSKVNIFSTELDKAAVEQMAFNCSASDLRGDIKEWLDFDKPYLHNDVIRREPSICGTSDCPPGFTGSLCDITIGGCTRDWHREAQ